MPVSNEELLKAINKNNEETKSSLAKISTLLDGLLGEVNNLKEKYSQQNEKINNLEQEIKLLKREKKRNNFLIFKIPKTEEEVVEKKVAEACQAVGVSLPDYTINNCFRVGKGPEPRPILVSLNNRKFKEDIMKRKDMFLKHNLRISHDRTPEEREEGRRIYACINSLRAIDKNATYRRGFFKFRGSHLRLDEAERIVNSVVLDSQGEEQQAVKRKKTEEKLKQFEFRPRSSSLTATSFSQPPATS